MSFCIHQHIGTPLLPYRRREERIPASLLDTIHSGDVTFYKYHSTVLHNRRGYRTSAAIDVGSEHVNICITKLWRVEGIARRKTVLTSSDSQTSRAVVRLCQRNAHIRCQRGAIAHSHSYITYPNKSWWIRNNMYAFKYARFLCQNALSVFFTRIIMRPILRGGSLEFFMLSIKKLWSDHFFS